MRLLSPESLDEAQRAIFKDCERFFPEASVCVNVVLGREPWDVRPILLSQGNVSIMRFSPEFDGAKTRQLSGDLEGFARLFDHDLKVRCTPNERQFFIIRSFVTDTLQDELEKGIVASRADLERIVRQLIKAVAALSRRSMAHGHISPANLATVRGELVLLDPLMGAVQVTSDPYLPPESSFGVAPEPTADLFCLGKMIRTLLGDSLTPRQASVVEQLLLPSPRHRPPLAEVAVAFGLRDESGTAPGNDLHQGGGRTSSGKLLRSTGSSVEALGRSPDAVDVTPPAAKKGGNLGWIFVLLVFGGGIFLLKERDPSLYYSFAKRVPGLVTEHSVEFESEWASHQRPRMLVVARSAILRDDPAAINAITADVLGGANPEGVRNRFLRVALDELWRAQLSDEDVRAAVALSLAQLLPEGARTVPPLRSLHPAILLAIAGETQPLNSGKELQALAIEPLTKLPAPFGPLFSNLQKLGVSTVGHPATIGLAAIATGDTRAEAFEALMTAAVDEPKTRSLLKLVLPVIRENRAASEELFIALRDRGEQLGTLASWFVIEDLAGWSRVPALAKIDIIVDSSTSASLEQAQYADLLRHPAREARAFAVGNLRKKFFPETAEKLLVTLASDANALSREQTIALLAALKPDSSAAGQFVSKWFELKPNPDTVVLLLLARSHADSSDVFNLEAARYLRRNTWQAPLPLLELLVNHPEPLARVLAYGKLNATVAEERLILKNRLSIEKDEGCLKAIMAKLSVESGEASKRVETKDSRE